MNVSHSITKQSSDGEGAREDESRVTAFRAEA